MENEVETSFKQSLKKSAIGIALFILISVVLKVIFRFSEVKSLIQELRNSNHIILAILTILGTVLFIWIIFSLIGSLIYYAYQKRKMK